jgi:copper chaperone CopZ
MSEVTETVAVNGFRCERCVARLTAVLEDHPGLYSAHGNLMGEVTLTYDDDLTSRSALLEAMGRGGFHESRQLIAE